MKARQQPQSLEAILANVPPVPPAVRYYDDFSERDLIKVWCSAMLANLSPVSTVYYFRGIRTIPTDRLIRLLTCKPHDVRSEWKQCHSAGISSAQLVSLKNLLIVDAGASEEELAAFMGHSDLDTGLIYFRSSASQAERVNQALAVSAVYQGVVKIAHNHFISVEELAALKGDQQVAGVPHGIPISGIGGCSQGQPTCPYNPVLSCYGCSRFMPVAQAAIHKSVLNDLREVMKLFYASSRGERGSPAFQMEATISSVQAANPGTGRTEQ